MPEIKTSYDTSSMTLSVDDEEVSRALGVLADKTPAVLKVAVNTTARQARKLMLTEAKGRYDVNAAGKRMLEDLKQRQKATNSRPAAIIGIMKDDLGALDMDLGYFRTIPSTPYMGANVWKAPEFFRARVLKGSPMKNLSGTREKSKGFLVEFKSGHIGMVQRLIGVPAKNEYTARGKKRWKPNDELSTMDALSASSMHRTVWRMKETDVEEMLQQNTKKRIQQLISASKRKGVI